MEEIFKVYKEATSCQFGHRIYEVSNLGRVRINGEIVKRTTLSNGYVYVTKGVLLHRAVAELFVLNPDNKPEVDHINCNKTDNRAENLRWVTHSENMKNPITHEIMKEIAWKSGDEHPYKGTKWMTNGKDEMKVFQPWIQDMLIFGWKYGRLKRKK